MTTLMRALSFGRINLGTMALAVLFAGALTSACGDSKPATPSGGAGGSTGGANGGAAGGGAGQGGGPAGGAAGSTAVAGQGGGGAAGGTGPGGGAAGLGVAGLGGGAGAGGNTAGQGGVGGGSAGAAQGGGSALGGAAIGGSIGGAGTAGASAGGAAGGAGGAGLDTHCGSPVPNLQVACSSYCSSIDANCTDANSQFASFDACLAACTLPTWSCGIPNSQTGNTVLCRLTYAKMAATSAPTACPNAGPSSPVCQ